MNQYRHLMCACITTSQSIDKNLHLQQIILIIVIFWIKFEINQTLCRSEILDFASRWWRRGDMYSPNQYNTSVKFFKRIARPLQASCIRKTWMGRELNLMSPSSLFWTNTIPPQTVSSQNETQAKVGDRQSVLTAASSIRPKQGVTFKKTFIPKQSSAENDTACRLQTQRRRTYEKKELRGISAS
jgi:hypothetical protein